jgi:hypothetical protein
MCKHFSKVLRYYQHCFGKMYNKWSPKEMIKRNDSYMGIAVRGVDEWATRIKIWPQFRERKIKKQTHKAVFNVTATYNLKIRFEPNSETSWISGMSWTTHKAQHNIIIINQHKHVQRTARLRRNQIIVRLSVRNKCHQVPEGFWNSNFGTRFWIYSDVMFLVQKRRKYIFKLKGNVDARKQIYNTDSCRSLLFALLMNTRLNSS